MARWEEIGPEWHPRSSGGWAGVWERTGAQAPSVQEEDPKARRATQEENARNAAEEEEERQATKWRKATPAEEREDKARCGVAMAARARALWERGTQVNEQGCPACCSRSRGWRWERDVGATRIATALDAGGRDGEGAVRVSLRLSTTTSRDPREWREWQDGRRGSWVREGGGGAPRQATLIHVLCGECEGVPQQARKAARDAIR